MVHAGEVGQMLQAAPEHRHAGDRGAGAPESHPGAIQTTACARAGGVRGQEVVSWIVQYSACHAAAASSTVQGASGTVRASSVL